MAATMVSSDTTRSTLRARRASTPLAWARDTVTTTPPWTTATRPRICITIPLTASSLVHPPYDGDPVHRCPVWPAERRQISDFRCDGESTAIQHVGCGRKDR